MKMQMSDLLVMLDSLKGSISIIDRGTHWGYTLETRKAVIERMSHELDAMHLEINLVDSAESEK